MDTTADSYSKDDLIFLPQFISGGRKKHIFSVVGSFFFVLLFLDLLFTRHNEDILKIVGGLSLFSLAFFVYLLQVTWGPLLIVNKHGVSLRPNPLLKRITLRWEEIGSITSFRHHRQFYLGVTLAPAHLDAFLQRQSPLTRKMLTWRLKRLHLIARLPQLLLECSTNGVLESIQEQYQTEIQQYHITIEAHIFSPWQEIESWL